MCKGKKMGKCEFLCGFDLENRISKGCSKNDKVNMFSKGWKEVG